MSAYATTEEALLLENINVVMSSLSICGSFFIIFCYFKFQGLRTFAFQLVLFVSISDAIAAIGYFLGDSGGNADTHLGASDFLCQFQSILISYGSTASMLWSCSIAYTLYKAVLSNPPDPRFAPVTIGGLRKYYIWVCFGIPVITTVIPLFTDSYGDTGGWCWILPEPTINFAWRIVCFYLLLWAVVIYNSVVYYKVYKHFVSRSGEGVNPMISKIKYYPLVLVICFFFDSINAFYEIFTGSDFLLWLQALQVFFASSTGLANAMVYGLTPAVRKEVGLMMGYNNERPGIVMSDDPDPDTKEANV